MCIFNVIIVSKGVVQIKLKNNDNLDKIQVGQLSVNTGETLETLIKKIEQIQQDINKEDLDFIFKMNIFRNLFQ